MSDSQRKSPAAFDCDSFVMSVVVVGCHRHQAGKDVIGR
jgi:hypothetical protein